MPLCIRFVDKNKNIREEFLQFTQLTRVTGEAIAKQLFSDLQDLNIDIKKSGQGYDGAKNISNERVGVQAYIKRISPLVVYIHCSGWSCLNLVISHSCTVPSVQNVLDQMNSVCLIAQNAMNYYLKLLQKMFIKKIKEKP